MLPLVDKIAAVVGVDTSLLTYRTPRSTHVKTGGAHGANRPGTKVPPSLNALVPFGPSAVAIYQTLAKSFLAMFGEDYVYDTTKGHVKDYPAFKTSFSRPVDFGFKHIFDTESEVKDDKDKPADNITPFGKQAIPFVDEGYNKRPPKPTSKWVQAQLERYNVGTGATRLSTLSEIVAGKAALLTDKRGVLGVTQIGEVSAVLLEGSYVADVKVTEQLFTNMADVGKFKMEPGKVISSATALVKHDKDIFIANGKKIKVQGIPKGVNPINKSNTKQVGSYTIEETGKAYNIKVGQTSFPIWKIISEKRITETQVKQLLEKGRTGLIKGFRSNAGNPFNAYLVLKDQKVTFEFEKRN